jgi:DNA-binding NtrC family response regulator
MAICLFNQDLGRGYAESVRVSVSRHRAQSLVVRGRICQAENRDDEVMRARPGIGILCMSGYDPTQKNSKWLKVQNIEFLEKPFSSGRLAQALDAAIAR